MIVHSEFFCLFFCLDGLPCGFQFGGGKMYKKLAQTVELQNDHTWSRSESKVPIIENCCVFFKKKKIDFSDPFGFFFLNWNYV